MSHTIARIGACTLALGLGLGGLAGMHEPTATASASTVDATRLAPPPKRDSAKLRFDIDGRKDTITVIFSHVEGKSERVFGKVVPFDSVWRVGNQNNPTIFRTTAPLQLQGTRLPPGTYTLYAVTHEHVGATECQSLAMELKTSFSGQSANPWRLMLNKANPDSVTTYDPEQDQARLIMYTCELDNFEEKMNVRLLRNGGKTGQLALAWGEYQAWIDFLVLKPE